MRVKGDLPPAVAFTLDAAPNRPGYCVARFYENTEPYVETRNGVTESGYVYDEYDMELLMTDTLEDEISAQYKIYLEQAKMNEIMREQFDPIGYHSMEEEVGEISALMVEQEYKLILMELGMDGGDENAV